MIPRARLLSAVPSALLGALFACGSEPAVPRADPTAVDFELRDVVSAELAKAPPGPPAPALDDAELEELEGLVALAASDGSLLEIAREDVARMASGSAAVWSSLAELAGDAQRGDAERAAAVDLLGASDAAGAHALAGLVRSADSPWVRARAAWRLSNHGPDHVVPDLILCLKYETDHETVIWTAAALARHDNLAGLDGLTTVASDGESGARAEAARQLEALCARLGAAGPGDLASAWERPASERGFGGSARSELFRFAVLRWIARLAEYQLRGVDDARFILERLDATAARELAATLHDRDVYVRVHSAQCLQRMGRRGLPAGEDLLAALGEPELAPHAAVALGRVGHAPAEGALVALLAEDTAPALRLAAARGLGWLDSFSAEEAGRVLVPLLEAEPAEIAQAAAASLLRRDPSAHGAAAALARWLTDPRVDPGSSERALGDWLEERGETGPLERWRELDMPRDRVETLDESRARRRERSGLVLDLTRQAAARGAGSEPQRPATPDD